MKASHICVRNMSGCVWGEIFAEMKQFHSSEVEEYDHRWINTWAEVEGLPLAEILRSVFHHVSVPALFIFHALQGAQ